MQIVIDLPDENYQVTLTKIMLACYGCRITELPKGHGRLVDLDQMREDYWDGNYMEIHFNDLDNIKTIIEADKAESEVDE